MSNVIPLTVLSAVAVLDNKLEGWTLLEVPATEPRVFSFVVAFERAFSSAPLVHAAIAGFDVENHDSARLRVRAENITPTGFVIRVETWLNTRVWAVEVSWLAIGYT